VLLLIKATLNRNINAGICRIARSTGGKARLKKIEAEIVRNQGLFQNVVLFIYSV